MMYEKGWDVLRVDHDLYIHNVLHLHGKGKTPVSSLGEGRGRSRGTGWYDTLVDPKGANEMNTSL